MTNYSKRIPYLSVAIRLAPKNAKEMDARLKVSIGSMLEIARAHSIRRCTSHIPHHQKPQLPGREALIPGAW